MLDEFDEFAKYEAQGADQGSCAGRHQNDRKEENFDGLVPDLAVKRSGGIGWQRDGGTSAGVASSDRVLSLVSFLLMQVLLSSENSTLKARSDKRHVGDVSPDHSSLQIIRQWSTPSSGFVSSDSSRLSRSMFSFLQSQ